MEQKDLQKAFESMAELYQKLDIVEKNLEKMMNLEGSVFGVLDNWQGTIADVLEGIEQDYLSKSEVDELYDVLNTRTAGEFAAVSSIRIAAKNEYVDYEKAYKKIAVTMLSLHSEMEDFIFELEKLFDAQGNVLLLDSPSNVCYLFIYNSLLDKFNHDHSKTDDIVEEILVNRNEKRYLEYLG